MNTVTNPSVLGWSYSIDPYMGQAVSVIPGAGWDQGALYRGWTPERILPWTPYSYPGVGREPGAALPPTEPAIPSGAGPAQVPHPSTRKRALGI